MIRRCEQFQARLTDVVFDETELDRVLNRHLADCPECAEYFYQLHRVQAALDSFSLDNEVNEAQIRKAFLLAESVRQKQRAWHEVLLFMLAALVALLVTYGLSALLTPNLVFYLQGFFYLLTPVLLIPFMRKRCRPELSELKEASR